MRKAKAKEWVDKLFITPQSQPILSPHGQPISLSQPSRVAQCKDNNVGQEGDREENVVGDSGEGSYEDSDFDELGEDIDEEGDVISLIDSDKMSEQETDSNLDDLRHPGLENEIPKLIDTGELDDNGNPIENIWIKICLNVSNGSNRGVNCAYKWLLRELVENWTRYTFPLELKYLANTTNFVWTLSMEKLRSWDKSLRSPY
ncbi:hypothetical protein Cgig2_016053 [Carnegiea gigantea]|uniref:Uncharacterized protein n=1 Tax=Carnegiea gigantea TaxID=171969 RepID=A0A9Q1JWY1_9CARY|nr:hypothetical protein Cgig2_016053 [Carnegiea gigantea]